MSLDFRRLKLNGNILICGGSGDVYKRQLLISQKPNDYPEVRKLLKELINEINRIGININQIVFNSNAQLLSLIHI